jgi:predicted transcriptional regulator
LGLFSRVTPDAALDHPARRRLCAAIEASPGIHLQELVRVTGSGRSTIEHHLDKLVDTGLVQRRVAAGYACYFPARTDRRVMAAAPALRSATARNILEVALAEPGITAQGIAESVGVGRSTVHHHLQRLAEAGVLRQDRDGASLHWYPTDAAAKVAAQ